MLALSLATVPSLARADVTTTLVCTNPNSGATWDVKIDFDHHTVDSFPADINDRYVTWEDTRYNEVYEFDRTSGDLTMRGPSSMGGYFIYDRCSPRK
jgi:hypothetical protein